MPITTDPSSTATLAARIAADVVATADQCPAVRTCTTFSELHDVYDVYDANESIIAACGGECAPDDEAWTDAVNAATDAVAEAMETGGFAALVVMAAAA